MKIVIAGGSGFIGRPLVQSLLDRGHDVVVLSRRPDEVHVGRGHAWDGLGHEIGGAGAVVNLAGENVGAGRWTEARKKRIVASRIETPRPLLEAMRAAPDPKRVYISASAVGFYGPRGDEVIDESGTAGSGFLADVTRRWEEAAHAAEAMARLVILRFGVVLDPEGGALKKMMLPFRLGAGGPVGSGSQWMSWIARDDAVRIVAWAIESDSVQGTYNATAPEPVTNRHFAQALGRAMHRPSLLPAPAFALRLLYGQMAEETVLAGQRVVPARATAEGFVFRYPSIDAALRHALSSAR